MCSVHFDIKTIDQKAKWCDEEEVIFTPSSELIPDEFEHNEPDKGSVIIFHSRSEENNKNVLFQTLSDQNYLPTVFPLSKKEEFLNDLNKVANENHENTTCLIIFFLGSIDQKNHFFLDDDANQLTIKDIWSKFTGSQCPLLKNKPKIFIFQVSKKLKPKLAFDRGFENPPKGAYDVPSEADMLLVFNKVENLENQEDFVREFCHRIKNFGKRDDVINLISQTTVKEQRPIVLSTLTRKFYFAYDKRRDYSYDIYRNYDIIMNELKQLRKKITSFELGLINEDTSHRSTELEKQTYATHADSSKEKDSTRETQQQTSILPINIVDSISSLKTVTDMISEIDQHDKIAYDAHAHSSRVKDSTNKIQEQISTLLPAIVITEVSTSCLKTVKDIVLEIDEKCTNHKLERKTYTTQTDKEKDSVRKVQGQMSTSPPKIINTEAILTIDTNSTLHGSIDVEKDTYATQTDFSDEKDSTRVDQEKTPALLPNTVETEVSISSLKTVKDIILAIDKKTTLHQSFKKERKTYETQELNVQEQTLTLSPTEVPVLSLKTVKNIVLSINEKGAPLKLTDLEIETCATQTDSSRAKDSTKKIQQHLPSNIVGTEDSISSWKTVKDIVLALNEKTQTDSSRENFLEKSIQKQTATLPSTIVITKPPIPSFKTIKDIVLAMKEKSTQIDCSRQKDSKREAQGQTSEVLTSSLKKVKDIVSAIESKEREGQTQALDISQIPKKRSR